MKPYLEDKETVLAEAGSSMEGLSDEEAAKRLARDGLNRLKEGEKESLLRKFLGKLKDPMTIVLIIAAMVSAITALYAGESLTDTIIILAVVLINACLGVYQESKAEAAIEALPGTGCGGCGAWTRPGPPACARPARGCVPAGRESA